MRIAMWSGPRNLSTAMMYSFGARPDFAVWDEPFYAAYLAATGIDHPMRNEVLAAQDQDPQKVALACIGSIPDGKPHFYMKHMPHHMVAGFPLDWAKACVNVNLIRHPARGVASYGAKRDEITLGDIGFQQQAQLYDRLGGIIIDSADIRDDPEAMLQKLCAAIGLPWDSAMLSWPAGGRPEDGAWAPHWYGAIHRSTGFAGPEGPPPIVEGRDAALVAAALPAYEKLAALKLT